jgi:hypothetical protein
LKSSDGEFVPKTTIACPIRLVCQLRNPARRAVRTSKEPGIGDYRIVDTIGDRERLVGIGLLVRRNESTYDF